ncbi:hypothetical protein ACQP1S_11355 [Micromonospora matsumotoense]|uniref:hypothetical protein n=1 Tax=Micromonospora matsumotoense TaxID=121616 RepID=UPI003D90D3BE
MDAHDAGALVGRLACVAIPLVVMLVLAAVVVTAVQLSRRRPTLPPNRPWPPADPARYGPPHPGQPHPGQPSAAPSHEGPPTATSDDGPPPTATSHDGTSQAGPSHEGPPPAAPDQAGSGAPKEGEGSVGPTPPG